MPTYEYRCKSCGQHLEVVQSFTEDPLTECPGCGGQLRKVFDSIGIAFKGSGFYRNDSRAPASTSASGNGSSDKSDTSSKPDKKESTSSTSGTGDAKKSA